MVEFYVSKATPTPLDHVVLSAPPEFTDQRKGAAFSLAKRQALDVAGLPPQYQLTPTYLGLLLSSQSAAVQRVADRILTYFKNQLREQGVAFQKFTWADLIKARVVGDAKDYPFVLAVLQAFELHSDGSWSPVGESPTAEWRVPRDIVDFRTFADIDKLQVRVAVRRMKRSPDPFSPMLETDVTDEVSPMPKHPKDVFVVHGRNKVIRDAVFDFLRSVGLNPMEFEEVRRLTGKPSPYIGEILDAAFDRAQAVVVVFSGDDEARLRVGLQGSDDPPHETSPTPQARANVLFEAGMAMGRDAGRTILVEFGKLRPFSDLAGRHTVRMTTGSATERKILVERLSSAGCDVVTAGRTDWLDRDYFEKVFSEAGRSASSA